MRAPTGAVSPGLGFEAPPVVRDALAALGRTEDVRLAPGGRRLAIACFARERIAVVDVEISVSTSGPAVAVTSVDELASTELREPHGLDFVDDDTLVVGNRAGGIAVFRLHPSGGAGGSTATGPGDREPEGQLDGPGSVAVRSLEPGSHMVLACNNFANTITRHTLDGSGTLVGGEVVARKWLDVPDGLALSHDGRWLAVSNHNTHLVFLYQVSELAEDAGPVCILRGVKYPHGVRFGGDDSCLVVADAGAPHVHAFLASGSGWEGVRYPDATITVMDDATFARGRHNPREGGPKGLDVDPRSNVLIVTSECLPLAFFDLAQALEGGGHGRTDVLSLRYELDLLAERDSTKAEAAEAHALVAEILGTKSWRMGEPIRRSYAAARRLQRRIRTLRVSAGS